MRYFLIGFLSTFISQYLFNLEFDRAFKISKRDRRERIEGLEDVLTDEEKEILMNL